MKVIVLILSSLFFLGNSFAAKEKNSGNHKFKWIKGNEMKGLIIKARKRSKKRSVANSSINLSRMSKEFKEIQAGIFAADTPEKIDHMLNELEKNIDSLPNDAKFLATQLLLLKPFRGLTYRMIPLAEKERISHSFLRTQVKKTASNMNVHLPELVYWEAGFKYITEPFKVEGEVVSQFKDKFSMTGNGTSGTLEFQKYIENEIHNALATAISRIESINLDNGEYIIWDNRTLFGQNSFQDDIEDIRYRKITKAELNLALSSLHMGLHYINYFVSYDIRGLLSLSRDIGKLYGIDGFLSRDPNGVSSKQITDVMNERQYRNIFTFKDGYEEKMKTSYLHLKQGLRYLRIAREEIRNKPVDRFLAIDPSKVNVFDTDIEKQLKNIECLIQDQNENNSSNCPIRSAVTGHTVVVDLKRFYDNPPKDLKAFLPTSHETGSKKLSKHGVKYPNYYIGRPNAWNLEPYKNHIFPTLGKQEDVMKYVRTLRQSYGGEAFGAPLTLFVQ